MPERATPGCSRYLVEWYRPGLTSELLERTAYQIGRSAAEPTAEGTGADLLLTLFVPEDEVAFCLFAADSAACVERACRRAKVPFDRITEAITSPEWGKQ